MNVDFNPEYKYFTCSIEDVNTQLNNYGVASVENILTAEECTIIRNGIWEEMKKLTKNMKIPLELDNINSYNLIKSKLYAKHSMLIQHYGVGHFQSVWDVRQNTRVASVFSKIWDTREEDLITSFDGISIYMPPEMMNSSGFFKNNLWLHTDQNPYTENLQTIQGLVNLYDVNEGDASLLVLEKSHKYHNTLKYDDEGKLKDKTKLSDWYKITESEYNRLISLGCNPKICLGKTGSMFLFDSRTIHSGIEAMNWRNNPNYRMVVYVCMTPRSFASDKILKKRIKIFEDLRMTSHYPHKALLFTKNPRTYGGELPNITPPNKPTLNDLGRRLVGYEQ